MGMAASQARLLTITARLHDVEYAAQSIQNAKIALATQSDQVYQAYLAALDATTLTVKDSNGQTIVANFNTLCGINAAKVGNYRYTLKDEKGRLIVPDDIAADYQSFLQTGGDDAYDFAYYMLSGGDTDFNKLHEEEDNVKNANPKEFQTDLVDLLKKVFSLNPNYTYDNSLSVSDNEDQIGSSMSQFLAGYNQDDPDWQDFVSVSKDLREAWEKYEAAKNGQEYKLYQRHGEEVYKAIGMEDDYNSDDFQYYVNIFKQIEANGGAYIEISEFNGIDGIGVAATDSDWLQNMIKSGRITIDIASIDKNGNLSFASTGVPSDERLEYTTTTTIDKSAYAKAEAEYEHKTREINQKDKKFDMELSKLETERSALTTEYESVKKVTKDNIERTFGIFS